MKRELFDSVVEPSITVGAHQWYSVPLSIISHVVVVAILIIAPLTATNVLPTPQSVLVFAITPPPPPTPPPPLPEIRVVPPTPADVAPVNPNLAPTQEPSGIAEEPPFVPAMAAPARLPVSNTSTALTSPSTPVSLATPPPQPSRPIPVGGAVGEPRKLHHVPPVYPAVARAARVSGVVILEATIAKDGSVRDARILRSNAMFDQAAIDAVRQWRYTTPTLNGVPVDVTMTVTVRFTID